MTRMTAFEVSINGEHHYTVGAEKWQLITAQVLGHHIDPEEIRGKSNEEIRGLPDESFDNFRLHASVSVSGEDVRRVSPRGRVYTKSRSGSYPTTRLSPGDVVQIRIVETHSPDSPEWQSDDPRFPGQTVLLPDSDTE